MSLRLLALYPKKAGSAVVGFLVRRRLPAPLRRPLLSRFAAAFGADLAEADRPLEAYVSFLDFFTRRLKPGLRPQAPAVPGGINSPVDGLVIAEGNVEEGTLLQAKGLPYRLDELLDGDPLAAELEGARYETLYLAPKDYHRIHVPLSGVCVAVGRVEGELWPVNAVSTVATPRLYVRRGRLEVASLPCAPGDDLGAFELGSTVVLLVGGRRGAQWNMTHGLGPVKVGERLGSFPV